MQLIVLNMDVILNVCRVHCRELEISRYRGDSAEISLEISASKKKKNLLHLPFIGGRLTDKLIEKLGLLQLQSIKPRMLNTTQIQFLHKSITSNISTTTSINYHATYLVLDVTSSVKYIFPLLIYIIFFDFLCPSSCDWPNWHLQWVVGMITLGVGMIRIIDTINQVISF